MVFYIDTKILENTAELFNNEQTLNKILADLLAVYIGIDYKIKERIIKYNKQKFETILKR